MRSLSSASPSFDWTSVRDAFDVGTSGGSRKLLLVVALMLIAIGFGVATVAFGNVFSGRPIFYLAMPVLVVMTVAVALDPLRCFIALVLLRCILDPICVKATFGGFGGLGGLFNFAIIALAGFLLLTRDRQRITREVVMTFVPFVVLMAVDVVRSPDLVTAIRAWLTVVTYASVFYGAFFCVRDAKDLDRLLRWMLLSSIPVFVYAISSYAYLGPTYVLEAGEGVSGRLASPLPHPNILAFYVVVQLAAWLCKMRRNPLDPTLTLRNIAWGAHLVMLLALLAGTQTRAAWVGAGIVFLIYGIFVRRSYLVMMVVGVALAMLIPDVRDRVLDLASNNEVYTYSKLNSFAWRKVLWASALAWLPPVGYVIGEGTGSFFFHSLEFFSLAYNTHWNAHNVYVQLLFDMGALGVVAFLAIFAQAFRSVWIRRALPPSVRVTTLALIVAFAFECYSDNMIDYLVVNWNCWFLIGLVIASSNIARRDEGRALR